MEEVEQIFDSQPVLSEERHIVYAKAAFWKRLLAKLIDFLAFAFLTVSIFTLNRLMVTNTEKYKTINEEVINIQLNSGLYKYDSNGLLRDQVSILNEDKILTGGGKFNQAKSAIDKFYTYANSVCEEEYLITMKKEYDEYRLQPDFKYEGKALFIKDSVTGEIKENEELVGEQANTSYIFTHYYRNVYAPYIDKYLQAYLLKYIPNYYEDVRYIALMVIWAEIFPAYCFSGILVYFVPTLVFRHGRKTLGKLAYRIGYVDSRILAPSFARNLCRFAIFYVFELILSIFTFGIPFIISVSMMAFSKKNQTFSEYMTGIREVDTSENKIFVSFSEIDLSHVKLNKEPIDFKMTNYD